MQHHFDIEIAEKYGLIEAILLDNFWFWITKNEANERNYYDGEYWTYNSTKALTKLFPYLTQRKIQNALGRLIERGVLIAGNYNQSAYDRTLWYAFTEKGKSIMQKREMDESKKVNGKCEKGKPIPYTKPDDKPNRKTFMPPTVDEVREYCCKIKSNIDPEAFVDYYAQQGWKLSNGNPMKDWKASVRLWEKRGKNTEPKGRSNVYQPEPPKYRMFEPSPKVDKSPMPAEMREKYKGFIDEL